MIDQSLTSVYLWADLQPYAWFALFALLSMADGAMTIYALKRGAAEANPVIKWLAKRVGIIPTLAAIKLAGAVAIFSILQSAILYMPLVVLFYAGVCAWNVRVILRNGV